MNLKLLLLWHMKTPSGMILDFEVEIFSGTDKELQSHLEAVRAENEQRQERLKVLWQIAQTY